MANGKSGLPARYFATLPTLVDGEASPIMVDNRGRVIISPATIATGQAYTTSNVVTTRTLNASTATTGDVANVLGSLIADLKTIGILS